MKKHLIFVITISILLSLTGCGDQSNTVDTTAENTTHETVTTQELVETQTPEPEPNADLKNFRVSQNEQISGFYLKKDGQLYNLQRWATDKNNTIIKDFYIEEIRHSSVGIKGFTESFIIAYDKSAGIPALENDDYVVYYSQSNIYDLKLYRAELAGYTIRAIKNHIGGGCYEFVIHKDNNKRDTVRTDHYEVKICDDKENIIEDRFPLEQGKEYTIYWYVGTQYNEVKMIADYPYYHSDWSEPIIIEGTLTKEGYAVYDLSSVPKGIYYIEGNGLIEKK